MHKNAKMFFFDPKYIGSTGRRVTRSYPTSNYVINFISEPVLVGSALNSVLNRFLESVLPVRFVPTRSGSWNRNRTDRVVSIPTYGITLVVTCRSPDRVICLHIYSRIELFTELPYG
jgi:hypothetical protein